MREIEQNDFYIIRITDCSFNLETNIVKVKIKCNVIKDKMLIESF